jgi:hypothetical protein
MACSYIAIRTYKSTRTPLIVSSSLCFNLHWNALYWFHVARTITADDTDRFLVPAIHRNQRRRAELAQSTLGWPPQCGPIDQSEKNEQDTGSHQMAEVEDYCSTKKTESE